MHYYFHHSSFYLNSIIFITPASIYIVFFSLIQPPLNTVSFITTASIYVVLVSFIQLPFTQYLFYRFYLIRILSSLPLLFIQHYFHSSNFYLYYILFITPSSI